MNNSTAFFALWVTLLATATGLAQDSARTAPKPIVPRMPAYPAALVDTGLNGTATIDLLVQPDGSVTDARVKSADHDAFAATALAAVAAWRFEPGTRGGTPAAMRVTVPFNFVAPVEQQLNAKFKRKVFQPLPEPAVSVKTYGKKLKVRKDVPPAYPRALMGSGVTETVEIAFVVAPDGTTLNPAILGKPRREFMLAALFAVAQSTYEPPLKDGRGVYVETVRKFRIAPPARRGRGGPRGPDGGFGGDPGGFGGGGGFPDPGN